MQIDAADVYRVEVRGGEFGETYHTALACITCTRNQKPNGAPIEPLWVGTTNADQKRFLGKVALYMKLRKSPNSEIYFNDDEIKAAGVKGADDAKMSSNSASDEVAKALKALKLIGDAEINKEKKLIRDVFLFNPVLDQKLPKQPELDGNLRQSIVTELEKREIDKTNDKVVVFNRQQPDSPNRNLNKAMLVAIIKHSTVNHFLINSSANQEQAFNTLWTSVPADVRQGKTYKHIGRFLQEKQMQDGTEDANIKKADAFTFQLNVFDVLNKNFKLTRSYGVKSGALDGPALLGIRTLYTLGAGDNDNRVKYIGLYYLYGKLDV